MIVRFFAASAPEGGEQPNPLLPADYDIIWSSVIFVTLLTFFWFKVLPGFKKMLDERAKAIEGRLAEAEEAQKAAERRTATVLAEQEQRGWFGLVSQRQNTSRGGCGGCHCGAQGIQPSERRCRHSSRALSRLSCWRHLSNGAA